MIKIKYYDNLTFEMKVWLVESFQLVQAASHIKTLHMTMHNGECVEFDISSNDYVLDIKGA